jgi:ligand-binding sensor protein
MRKSLSRKQITTMVKNVSSTYDESLIDFSIELVINDREAAEYLCDTLRSSLDDEDIKNFIEEEFGVEE